jgi:hypothetical protein
MGVSSVSHLMKGAVKSRGRLAARPVASSSLPAGDAAVQLLVDGLAAYRLTRLVTVDTLPVAVAVRERLTRWSRRSGHTAVAELVECPWCIGFWVALGVVVLRRMSDRTWPSAARTLAVSTIVGIVAAYLSDDVVQVKAEGTQANDDSRIVELPVG